MNTANLRRRQIVRLGAAAGISALGLSHLAIENAAAADSEISTTALNEAVSGYDPVAYFTEGKPVKGIRQFRLKHKGADWLFSSQKNLELFKNDTERYSPQYGGHCAFNIGKDKGKAVKANPRNFNIVNDKLYLNYDNYTQSLWYENQAELIDKGDANWPTVLR